MDPELLTPGSELPPRYRVPADYVPPPPDRSGRPVVVICDLWEAQDMIRPRLKSLGADEEKITVFTKATTTDSCGGHRDRRKVRFPLDLMMFEYILRQNRRCQLIVIDNLESYCETPQQLRQAIKELDEAAIYLGISIIATLQRNVKVTREGALCDKASQDDGLARCVWCITQDPSHADLLRFEPKRMAFCKKPAGIALRISDEGQVLWETLPPYQKPPTEAAQRKALQHSQMLTWLAGILGTCVVPAETIYDAGREEGYSRAKLIAARKELKARTFKAGFAGVACWLWTFKPESEVTPEERQNAVLVYKGLREPGSGEPGGPILFESVPAPGSSGDGLPEGRGAKGEGRQEERNDKEQKRENSGVLNENEPEIESLLARATTNLAQFGLAKGGLRDRVLDRFEKHLREQKNQNGKPHTGKGHAD